MRNVLASSIIMLFIAVMLSKSEISADDGQPVKVTFDEKSERIDLITGRELPAYTAAQRSSIQFILTRFDRPDDFINIYHDGVRQVKKSSLLRMIKEQEKFSIWRLHYTNGRTNHTPRVHHQVVSFIPINLETGENDPRIYVWLRDLEVIDWSGE